MTVTRTVSLDRTVSPAELRAAVSQISLREGLEFVTKQSARHFREATEASIPLVNSLNLSLLAKAFVLWGNPGGRSLRRTGGADDERVLLLQAVNSLPRYPSPTSQAELDESVVSLLVRQAHMIVATSDPLDANIARTYSMFHDIIGEGGYEVADPSSELLRTFGVSAEDLWTLALAMFSFHIAYARVDPRVWLFRTSEFVRDSPCIDQVNDAFGRVLARVSLTPEQFRERYYAEGSKYRDPHGRDGCWISEFNILRDFPVVRLGDDEYCAPFPVFAFTRGSVGFYFDLVEEHAQRELAQNPDNENAYDNAMSRTLGAVFQTYVGRQLSRLDGAREHLRPEFRYGPRGAAADTPDWLLWRPGRLPVFFECKARRPTLDVQRYGRPQDIEDEVRKGVAKALRQFTRFVQRADSGTAGLERYVNLPRMVYALVLYEPFAFHMLPDMRRLIDRVATELEPRWNDIRERVLFVPMWVRELETAVGLELNSGVPIEDQLEAFALYRDQAMRVERWVNNTPVFPRHLEEFLQENWNGGRRIVNPHCQELWNYFCGTAFQWIFGEDLHDYERDVRHRAIQVRAHQLWEERGRPSNDDWADWFLAEREIDKAEDFPAEFG
jgi:hypothetical protein